MILNSQRHRNFHRSLTPCFSVSAYSDNPDRDSLDGNLPSSSHGTNPPPAPPLGPLAAPASFTKGPNAKKKHKKLKSEEPADKEDKMAKRPDSESGDDGWEETEPW